MFIQVSAFLLCLCSSTASSGEANEAQPSSPSPILTEFPQPEEKYCVTYLRAIDPVTGQPRTVPIFETFRRVYESIMKSPITDDGIREIWHEKVKSQRTSATQGDDATLICNRFSDFSDCLPVSKIKEKVLEAFKNRGVSPEKTTEFSEKFDRPGTYSMVLPGIKVEWNRQGDLVKLRLKEKDQYISSRSNLKSMPDLTEDIFREEFLGTVGRHYNYPGSPELTQLVEDRVDTFRRQLVSASLSETGGLPASIDNMFPGDHVTDSELAPLIQRLQGGWSGKEIIEQGTAGDYGKDAPIGNSADYGSVVFDQGSVHRAFHDFVNNQPKGTIIDIAGAIGANTMQHIDRHRVILNDININELAVAYAFARQHMPAYQENLILNNAPAREVKLPPDSVTATFVGYLVKYMRGTDLDQLFKQIFDFTKPGGRLFMVELPQDNQFYSNQNCKPGTSSTNKNWPNECGYILSKARYDFFYGGTTPEQERNYFLNNISLDDIKNALIRTGFNIITSEKEPDPTSRSSFGWIAEKPTQTE